ncbi:MAG TPA: hypothetical protein VKX33_03945 [Cyclobacteriaceae bacterium]|nr:hypothetical protein [Cyclobacteriaceae bacterium]
MQNKTVALYFSNLNHDSILEVILKALKEMNCKIVLFTAKGISQKVFTDAEILYQATISNAQFTSSKIFKVLNEADFVIIDQLYSFRELVSFNIYRIKRPNMMLVHNCNTWFNPKMPRKLVHKAKHLMTLRISKRMGYFAVAGENMLTYCNEELDIEKVVLIPFRYADFDSNSPLPEYRVGSPIRVVVPGMISSRRNYHGLLDAIGQEVLKNKVELVLLGRPDGLYGQEILQKAKRMVKQGYKIVYWAQYIDHEEFELEIRKAHVLFSYFDPNYFTNNGQHEVYGVSKETGIALLMYNNAKVGILPSSFHQMKSIRNQTVTYSDLDQLKEILLSVYNGALDLNQMQSNAISNALSMNINNIVQRLQLAYRSQTTHL